MKRLGWIGIMLLVVTVVSAWGSSRNFGLGVVAGEPTGLKVKLWLNRTNAFDFGIGWGYYDRWHPYGVDYTDSRCRDYDFYRDNTQYCINRSYSTTDRYYWRKSHIHASYLIHNFSLIKSQERLPVFYGPGINVNYASIGGWHMGVRGVAGLAWIHRTGKFDVFLELAPVLQLFPGAWLEMTGGLGFRFYL